MVNWKCNSSDKNPLDVIGSYRDEKPKKESKPHMVGNGKHNLSTNCETSQGMSDSNLFKRTHRNSHHIEMIIVKITNMSQE